MIYVLTILLSVLALIGENREDAPTSGIHHQMDSQQPHFEIFVNYPPLSLPRENLEKAESVVDLNPYYKPSWVKEFISVEVWAIHDGKIVKSVHQNDVLSKEQKDLMLSADTGEEVTIKINYIPDNSLKDNDAKVFDFSFILDPDEEATFSGGRVALHRYLEKNVINKIPGGSFQGFDLTAIKFKIDKEGHIVDVHIFWPHEHNDIDNLLLESICNMPSWKPARYEDGTVVDQELVMTIGNMENCAVNLLNIRRD